MIAQHAMNRQERTDRKPTEYVARDHNLPTGIKTVVGGREVSKRERSSHRQMNDQSETQYSHDETWV